MVKNNKREESDNTQGGQTQKMSLDDNPAEKDSLGIVRYIKGLSKFISTCDTPMTLALQGGWGTGKTTLFDLVERDLVERDLESTGAKVIRFNAWPLSSAGLNDDLTSVLVSKIIYEVVNEMPDD